MISHSMEGVASHGVSILIIQSSTECAYVILTFSLAGFQRIVHPLDSGLMWHCQQLYVCVR